MSFTGEDLGFLESSSNLSKGFKGGLFYTFYQIFSSPACADPEIFMRGGPTKMVIFGHRRGGIQPPKNPEITFF